MINNSSVLRFHHFFSDVQRVNDSGDAATLLRREACVLRRPREKSENKCDRSSSADIGSGGRPAEQRHR